VDGHNAEEADQKNVRTSCSYRDNCFVYQNVRTSWDKTWKHLSDDILYRQRQLFRLPGMIFTFCLLLISLLLIYY
jgi:hypothetical protein